MIVLHILWLIIRTLLIILGILAALLLLVLLIILFCPIRYYAVFDKKSEPLLDYKSLSANIRVTWLMRILRIEVGFSDMSLQGPEIRIFGKTLRELLNLFRRKKKKPVSLTEPDNPEVKKQTEKAAKTENPGAEKTKAKESKAESKAEEVKAEKPEAEVPEAEVYKKSRTVKEQVSETEIPEKEIPEKEISENETPGKEQVPSLVEIISKLIDRFESQIERTVRRIDYAIKNGEKTINSLKKKAKWLLRYLSHERCKAALVRLKASLMVILKHIWPTRANGKLTFDAVDPSVTGWILGVMAISYPFHKNCIELCPLFLSESNILYGDVKLEGRIRLIVFVKEAVKIVLNKNVRFAYKKWRSRGGK